MTTSKRNIGEMAEMFGLPNELYTMKRGVKYRCEHEVKCKELFFKGYMCHFGSQGETDCGHKGCSERKQYFKKCDKLFRYDITIIPPLIINGHFNKTHGHIHATRHDEEYIVLEGEATFLMQKGADTIKDVYYVVAKKGDHVIIPGDYHHNTTNSGKTTLKLGNWVLDKGTSDYTGEWKNKGMVYYLTPSGWIWNRNYKNGPPLRNATKRFRKDNK